MGCLGSELRWGGEWRRCRDGGGKRGRDRGCRGRKAGEKVGQVDRRGSTDGVGSGEAGRRAEECRRWAQPCLLLVGVPESSTQTRSEVCGGGVWHVCRFVGKVEVYGLPMAVWEGMWPTCDCVGRCVPRMRLYGERRRFKALLWLCEGSVEVCHQPLVP